METFEQTRKKKARARRNKQKEKRINTWPGRRELPTKEGWLKLRAFVEKEAELQARALAAHLVQSFEAPTVVLIFNSRPHGKQFKGATYRNLGKAAVRADRKRRKEKNKKLGKVGKGARHVHHKDFARAA